MLTFAIDFQEEKEGRRDRDKYIWGAERQREGGWQIDGGREKMWERVKRGESERERERGRRGRERDWEGCGDEIGRGQGERDKERWGIERQGRKVN